MAPSVLCRSPGFCSSDNAEFSHGNPKAHFHSLEGADLKWIGRLLPHVQPASYGSNLCRFVQFSSGREIEVGLENLILKGLRSSQRTHFTLQKIDTQKMKMCLFILGSVGVEPLPTLFDPTKSPRILAQTSLCPRDKGRLLCFFLKLQAGLQRLPFSPPLSPCTAAEFLGAHTAAIRGKTRFDH